jgi:hypothetical protein
MHYPQIIPYFIHELQSVILISFNTDTIQKLLESHFEIFKHDKCDSRTECIFYYLQSLMHIN